LQRDACGVCGGRGETCRGCDGVANSRYRYNACGECAPPDAPLTCISGCDTRPFAVYKEFDRCGVCGGNNACVDCLGVPHGDARYDRCDVCGGDDECVDCRGVVGGSWRYDVCGQCAPDVIYDEGNDARRRNSIDCLSGCDSRPWSTQRYDACGVCGGQGACLDCAGTPNGSARYDVCDVCGGDGQSCRDCFNLKGGSHQYDVCDVCNGDGQSCRDCYGIVGGIAQRVCICLCASIVLPIFRVGFVWSLWRS
jgi:hypothetical protein